MMEMAHINHSPFLSTMRRTTYAGKQKTLLLLSICVSVLGFRTSAAAVGTAGAYPVYRLERAPVIDGRVEQDPAWAGVPLGIGFHVLGGRRPIEKQTSLRVGFTADHLYASFVCAEPDMTSLADSSKDNGSAIWKDDGVEIFILRAGNDHIFQAIVNAAGSRVNYQTDVKDPDMAGIAPLTESRAAAFKGKDFYSVEIEVPFKVLGGVPGDNESWGCNFGRNINLGKGGSGGLQNYSWAHTIQRYCEPDRFAQLIFHRGTPPAGVRKGEIIDALASSQDDTELHLIVSLNFDEGYGDVAHGQSAIINDGEILGATWAQGLNGRALKFEKEGDRVEVPDSESLKGITTALTLEVTAYFELETLSGTTGTLIAKAPGSGFGCGYYLDYVDSGKYSRSIVFGLAQDWGTRIWLESANAIATSGWHHVIATYDADLSDGKRGKMYVDGQIVGSFDQSITGINPSTLPLTIGSKAIESGKFAEMGYTFHGLIDNIRVWDKALSAAEIEKLYGAQWAKSTPVSPAPSEAVKDGKPCFQWTPAADGTGYIFQLANVPDFSREAMIKEPLATPEFCVKKALSPGVYYWRVWSVDKVGKPTAACESRAVIIPWPEKFETADTTPPMVTDVKPVSDTTTHNASPTISAIWGDDQGIDVKSAQLLLDGKDVTTRAAVTDKDATFTPESPLAKGVHTLEVFVKDPSGNNANRVRQHFSVGEPYTTVVKVGQDLITYINDEPFFPIMFYSDGISLEKRARAGFNSQYGGTAATAAELEELEKGSPYRSFREAGLKFCGSFDTLMEAKDGADGFSKSAPFYNKYVEFLAYSLDEPNSRPDGLESATKMYEIILANGHRRPLFCILNSPDAAGLFGKVGDGVMPDAYPVPNRPLVQVAKYIDHAYKMIGDKKPVWFCQQAFDWNLYGKYNDGLPTGKTKQDVLKSLRDSGYVFRPTPAEMRAMTYLALAHNAKGIKWWSATWGSGRLGTIVDFPEDYAAFEKLAGEVRYLSALLVAPEAPVQVRVAPEGLGLHLKTKSFDHKIYMIAVNPNENLSMGPVFNLPDGPYKKVDVLFENRMLRLDGKSTFRDIFAPAQVHVYRIQ